MKSIPKLARVQGSVTAPASKSYTNRALLLAMMSDGETTIENPLDSDDSRYMLEAIRKIGFDVRGSLRDAVTIGPRLTMYANDVELYVGNAGTAMRFLTGFLPFTPGRFILRGESRMHERPIGDLVDALAQLGAEVEYLEREGYPPIVIRGRKMRGGVTVRLNASLSSQFASALMMGGATLPDGLTVEVDTPASRPYIEMTRGILEDFGASVEIREIASGIRAVTQGGTLQCDRYRVEGDYSAASYWFAAGAAGGEVRVEGLDRSSAQGDRRFLDILESMGAGVEWGENAVTVTRSAILRGGRFDMNDVPDVVPTLAAIAPLAAEPIEIVNVANLRVKESDRIAALGQELRKLGARVEERDDGLTVHPGWNGEDAVIDPHQDHRLAMSFAIAGLLRGGVSIDHEAVVGKSYPRFFRDLDSLIRQGE
ncbi:MAG TPA: 3-phosphoshikimate 1-carboxyvinyltransferase [Thermoanaerobaculia bacterium]|nr:3-phosphoshikimate 1-carboxyvinyltransferase [Thermoanaerobaculia bacterium]